MKKTETLIFPDNYYNLRWYQKPVWAALDRGIKKLLLVWFRQSGKDTMSWLLMVGQAMKYPGNYFYIFPTQEEAKKALWDKIDMQGQVLVDCIPASKLIKKHNLEMKIKIKAGEVDSSGKQKMSTIQVVGLDYNPNSIRGITPRGVVFSEAAFQEPEVFRVILPALAQYKEAWQLFQSTPNGKNHFHRLYLELLNDPHAFVDFRQVLHPERDGYVDGILTVKEIRDLQKRFSLTDAFIEQEFGCSWNIGASGAIYSANLTTAQEDGRIAAFPYDRYKLVDTFFDLGYADPTAIWFTQNNGRQKEFINYHEQARMEFKDIASLLKAMGYRYRTHYLPWDAGSGEQNGETDASLFERVLKEYGIEGNVVVCPRSYKNTTINLIKSEFSNFAFDKIKCEKGLKALENYHFKFDKKKEVFSKEPAHDWSSHGADALGTVVAAMDQVKEWERSSKPWLLKKQYKDFNPLDW